jgi:ketosteroid isomerase-like protein
MHSRKNWAWFLLLFALQPIGLLAQEKSDSATVRGLEMKWAESYKQHSIDILSSLLADDFTITVEDGNVYSKAGYISHTADSKVHVQIAELSDLRVRFHGDVAIVTGSYHEKGESEGKGYGLGQIRRQMAGRVVTLQRSVQALIVDKSVTTA